MHGVNPTRKLDLSSGQQLLVQGTPFLTIQGEGPHAGLPAVFIRLWGCHLKCHFCDTDFESDPRATDIRTLADACRDTDLIVLTGGEPMRQHITPLVKLLLARSHHVQVETAGSFWWQTLSNASTFLEFVVSPKTSHVHDEIANRAIAWKYIVSAHDERGLDGLPIADTQGTGVARALAQPPANFPRCNVYLQPMDEADEHLNEANAKLCVQLAQEYGYRVSIQQHKVLGLP